MLRMGVGFPYIESSWRRKYISGLELIIRLLIVVLLEDGRKVMGVIGSI